MSGTSPSERREKPDRGAAGRRPSDGPLSEATLRRRARVRLEDMIGMGYFPDELGLGTGWPEEEQ